MSPGSCVSYSGTNAGHPDAQEVLHLAPIFPTHSHFLRAWLCQQMVLPLTQLFEPKGTILIILVLSISTPYSIKHKVLSPLSPKYILNLSISHLYC